MMHPKNRRRLAYAVFILIAVGILYQFALNPSGMIIPLLVFGAVFLLYKYPPSRIRRELGRFTRPRGPETPKRNVKKAKFRVIRGNKKDDDPPRYH